MNRNQKFVLILAGLAIAVFQIYGINEHGLDRSRGWPISFLISAGLLFVGFGNWKTIFPRHSSERSNPPPVPPKPAPRPVPRAAPQPPPKSNKFQYGIHISELDIAIEATKVFNSKQGVAIPPTANKRSPNWNSAAIVYASVRYVAQRNKLQINQIVWNTIVRAFVVRMSTEESPKIKMGDPGYKQLEEAAYNDLETIDQAVDEAVKGNRNIEPIVYCLAAMFGTIDLKPLSAIIALNAQTAHQKILPELLEDLS